MQMNERTINAQWCKEEKTDNDEDERGAEVERRSVDFSMEVLGLMPATRINTS